MNIKNLTIFCFVIMVGMNGFTGTLGYGTAIDNTQENHLELSEKEIETNNLADSPWPMFHHDSNHSGRSSYNTSHIDGVEKWRIETTANYIYSSPAVGSNGTIYMGDHDNNMYAISPNGTEKWRFSSNGNIYTSPALSNDGTLYIGSCDCNLYAINPNGTEKWKYHTSGNIYSSPVIASDGTIYIGSLDDKLYSINPNGTKKWGISLPNIEYSSPAVGNNGMIYVGGYSGGLYAINPNGTEKWCFSTKDGIQSSPAISSGGTIFIGSDDNNLYAINPDGTEKWNFSMGGDVRSSPAISSGGTIFVGSDDNNLYAINPDGTERWNFTTYGDVRSSPAIGSDGTIYVGSNDGNLYAIGPNNAPSPSNPSPSNQATGLSKDPNLKVDVSDVDGHTLDVFFYDSSSDNIIGQNLNVANGSIASVNWTGLEQNKTYSWYVRVDDGYDNITSPTWTFTTTEPPSYSSISPANGTSDQDLSLPWSVDIEDPEEHSFNWSIECNNSQTNSAVSDTNGTKTLSLQNLAYNTTYTVWVNSTDEKNASKTRWYTFTTRPKDIPSPPSSFLALPHNRTKIDLSWVKDSKVDSTYIEWNNNSDNDWNIGEHNFLYNGSSESTSHPGLDEGITYYYQAWAWNDTDKEWSAGMGASASTDDNQPVLLEYEYPSNESTGVDLSLIWHIDMKDPEGDALDWTIECSSGQANASTSSSNGTKNLTLNALQNSTQYTIWVNATDGYDHTREWYTLTTRDNHEPPIPSNFDASAVNRTAIKLTWAKGTNASHTYIEYNTSKSWDRGDGIDIYNGNGSSFEHHGLNPRSTYYYQAWSYNATDEVWSDSYSVTNATTINNPPALSNESPADDGNDIEPNLSQLSVNISDKDSDPMYWTIETVPNVGSASGNSTRNGTITCNLYSLDLNTNYTWYVNTTDGYDWTNESFTLSTRGAHTPEPPSNFTSTMLNRSQIELCWSVDSNATTTYIRYDTTDYPSNLSQGTKVYNGTGPNHTVSSLNEGMKYYFSAWSWNSTDNAWSVFPTITNCTTNAVPVLNDEHPADNAAGIDMDISQVSINISDSESVNWTIETNPYIGNESGTGEISGRKNCSIAGLSYNTSYTWYVNVTDGYDWTNESYTFSTKSPDESNLAPVFSDVSPTNGSENQSLDLKWSIYIEDLDGDVFNWSIECSNGDRNSSVFDMNGTKNLTLTGLTQDTQYTVWVNATDGMNEIKHWFTFTTVPADDGNGPPVITNPDPVNGSTDQPLELNWSVSIEDLEGDEFNWSIECRSGDNRSGYLDRNGTKNISLYDLEPSTQYTVWVNATEGSNETRRWFTFVTKEDKKPIIALVNPKEGENYTVGELVNITWTATDDFELPSDPITLSVSFDNGVSWSTIADYVGNNESYGWRLDQVSEEVIIRINCTDSSGQISSGFAGPFRVKASIESDIKYITPEPNSTGVLKNATIELCCTTPIDYETVDVALYSDNKKVSVTISKEDNCTLLIIPEDGLEPDSKYRIFVELNDTYENPINHDWNFETAETSSYDAEEKATVMDTLENYWWMILFFICIIIAVLIIATKSKKEEEPFEEEVFLGEETEEKEREDKEGSQTPLTDRTECTICKGELSDEISVECEECGYKYHENCLSILGECPMCGRKYTKNIDSESKFESNR